MLKRILKTTALLGVFALMLGTAGVAQAFDSGGNPKNFPGDNTVTWTGQGATNGEVNTQLCDAANTPDHQPNTAYLLWIFTTDGGSADTVKLHLGGTGSGDYDPDTASGNTFHFFTPYFVPDGSLTAYVSFNVLTTGNGAWNLVISHGCPGEAAAIASISTEIHLNADDTGGITVVSGPVALGSTVHDSGTLTTTPDVTSLPDGSSVTFYFYNDGTCDTSSEGDPGTYTDSSSTLVGGQDTTGGLTVDPALPKGPLGAGDYSYRAFFTSGDQDVVGDATSLCEPLHVNQSDSKTSTSVVREDTDPQEAVALNGHLPLGTSVHDTATVQGDPTTPFTPTGKVTYHFYNSIDCKSLEITSLNSMTWPYEVTINLDGSVPDSQSTGALEAGNYSFNAYYGGDTNYKASTSDCEPFVIDKGPTTTLTKVLDAYGNDVTGTTIPNGSVVHDSAIVGPKVDDIDITGTVDYYFSTNGCAGPFTLFDTQPVGTDSKDTAALGSGSYAFYAIYSGDKNYEGSTGACEPFNVRTFGFTMGFWGNKNGQALLAGTDAFSNPVKLGVSGGCYVSVDTAVKSLQILPSTLNGIGLTGCGGTNGLDSGINTASFNTLLAQNLALSYNIRYKSGYAGQTISGMGCTPVAGLTGASTVEQVRDYANSVIGNAKRNYGTVISQGTVGGLNTLLGCLNRES